jgi:hypothetical protein
VNNYGLVTFTFVSNLYGQWGPGLRRSVRMGSTVLPWHSSGLPGVLLDSRMFLALRWTMLGTILQDVASRHCFTWLLSLST